MRMARRPALFISDDRREIIDWLESVAEDQRRHHPGCRATAASVAREILITARSRPDWQGKLRR